MMNIPKSCDQIDQRTPLMSLYSSTLKETNVKIEIPNNEFAHIYNYNPIKCVRSRFKMSGSTVKKLKRHSYNATMENMTEKLSDIVSIRIICSFTSDIYQIADMVSRQSDVTVLYVKGYVKGPEPDGYKSYYMMVTIPIYLSGGPVETKMEIQIRAVAMDFRVNLEHEIHYKLEGHAPACLQKKLKACTDVVDMLDAKMYSLNEVTLESSQDDQEEKKAPESVSSNTRGRT